MVLFIFITAAALPRFFVLARVLVAGGAFALVFDLVLVGFVILLPTPLASHPNTLADDMLHCFLYLALRSSCL